MSKQIDEVMALAEDFALKTDAYQNDEVSREDLFAARRAVKNKLLELLPVWRPIESAPKDGTSILVCNHRNGVTQCAVYLSKRWLTTWQHEEITTEPTHWMPLPETPSV